MQWAYISHKRGVEKNYKTAITLTCFLGLAFLICQYAGWLVLKDNGVYINGNPAGSFVYVISMVHGVHILGGLIALLVVTFRAYTKPFNQKQSAGLGLITTYWHFVDFLWLYLFIFIQMQF